MTHDVPSLKHQGASAVRVLCFKDSGVWFGNFFFGYVNNINRLFHTSNSLFIFIVPIYLNELFLKIIAPSGSFCRVY